MNTIVWKCYRCNLIFKEEIHAIVHKDISNHSVSKIGFVVA